jgi:hypothetical protein
MEKDLGVCCVCGNRIEEFPEAQLDWFCAQCYRATSPARKPMNLPNPRTWTPEHGWVAVPTAEELEAEWAIFCQGRLFLLGLADDDDDDGDNGPAPAQAAVYPKRPMPKPLSRLIRTYITA